MGNKYYLDNTIGIERLGARSVILATRQNDSHWAKNVILSVRQGDLRLGVGDQECDFVKEATKFALRGRGPIMLICQGGKAICIEVWGPRMLFCQEENTICV